MRSSSEGFLAGEYFLCDFLVRFLCCRFLWRRRYSYSESESESDDSSSLSESESYPYPVFGIIPRAGRCVNLQRICLFGNTFLLYLQHIQ